MALVCNYLDQIHVMATDETACPECIAHDNRWARPRLYLTCGHASRCDAQRVTRSSAPRAREAGSVMRRRRGRGLMTQPRPLLDRTGGGRE